MEHDIDICGLFLFLFRLDNINNLQENRMENITMAIQNHKSPFNTQLLPEAQKHGSRNHHIHKILEKLFVLVMFSLCNEYELLVGFW